MTALGMEQDGEVILAGANLGSCMMTLSDT